MLGHARNGAGGVTPTHRFQAPKPAEVAHLVRRGRDPTSSPSAAPSPNSGLPSANLRAPEADPETAADTLCDQWLRSVSYTHLASASANPELTVPAEVVNPTAAVSAAAVAGSLPMSPPSRPKPAIRAARALRGAPAPAPVAPQPPSETRRLQPNDLIENRH